VRVLCADDDVGWMVDAESRPTFTELRAEFSKMSKDAGRYLVIRVRLTFRKNSLVKCVLNHCLEWDK